MSTQQSENYLRFFAIVLFANKRLIYFTVALFGVLSLLIAFVYPPVYECAGSLIVKSKKVPDAPEQAQQSSYSRGVLPPDDGDVLLEQRLVTDPQLVLETVRQLREEGFVFPQSPYADVKAPVVAVVKSLLVPFRRSATQSPDTPKDTERMQDQNRAAVIRGSLSSTIFPGSTIIDVRLRHHDPVTAQLVLNRLLSNYTSFRLKIFSDQSAADFFDVQVEEYERKLNYYDSLTLQQLRNHNVSDVDEELQGTLQLINNASQEIELLRGDVMTIDKKLDYSLRLMQRYAAVEQGQTAVLPPPLEFGDQSQSRIKLNEVLMGYYSEMRQFSKNSNRMRELAGLIKKEISNVISLLEEERTIQAELLYARNQRLASLRKRGTELRRLQSEMRRIEIDAQLTRSGYEGFSTKLRQSRLEQGSEASQWASVQVLSRPTVPVKPAFPNPPMVIAFGLIAGLFLALSLAWIKEFFDHTFKTPSQVEQILGLPVIVSIPAKAVRPKQGRMAKGKPRRRQSSGSLL